jgi:hypothetical protein
VVSNGHGSDSRLCFLDHVQGPCAFEIKPGQQEPRFNELEAYKKTDPKIDWDAMFAERGNRAP